MKLITLFTIFVTIVILLCFVYDENYDEHFQGSNEAIQNISSIYNSGKVSVNNVSAEESITSKTLTANKITTNAITTNKIIPSEENGNVSFSGGLTFGGSICAGSVCIPQKDFQKLVMFMALKDKMYNGDAIIYYDILSTLNNGNVISQSGSPNGWNNTQYTSSNLWEGLPILNIGNGGNTNPNGLSITVPANKTVIWVRITNDTYTGYDLYNSSGVKLNSYASGYRNLINIDPNGCAIDSYRNYHKWMPMPVPGAGKYVLVGSNSGNSIGSFDNWISGIAFGTNPWNHALNSAVAYSFAINSASGTTSVPMWGNSWNNDQLGQFISGNTYNILVPVVPITFIVIICYILQ